MIVTRLRPALPLATAAMAVATAACSAAAHRPSAGTDPPPRAASALVLGAVWIGGSPAPAGRVPLPAYALYGDGTLLAPGPVQGALPSVRAYHLTRRAAGRLYQRALDAGLASPRRYDKEVSDAGVLVVTLGTARGRAVTRVVQPDPADRGRSGAIARLARFDPATLAAGDQTGPAGGYRYGRLAAVTGGNLGGPVRPWPFAPLDGGEPVNHGRCVVLAGGDLAAATDLARNASPDTLWTSGVTPVRVTFRPLLPDETGCAALNLPG
jgi:hypothetical protein